MVARRSCNSAELVSRGKFGHEITSDLLTKIECISTDSYRKNCFIKLILIFMA